MSWMSNAPTHDSKTNTILAFALLNEQVSTRPGRTAVPGHLARRRANVIHVECVSVAIESSTLARAFQFTPQRNGDYRGPD
jgi:hypothetical protein